MPRAMARQKNKREPVEFPEMKLVRRLTPGRGDACAARVFQARDFINAAAADDAQHRFRS